MSHLADNVVLLQYLRAESEVKRALLVLKKRASDHHPRFASSRSAPKESSSGTRSTPINTSKDAASFLCARSPFVDRRYSVARLTFDNVPRYWSRRSTLCSSASITTSVNLVS